MKKIFALAALGATVPVAMAQNVQLYGIADAGYSRVTGLRGGTQNQIVSGIMEGSRFGLKGSEDIGGGFRALFTMEHRLELDTGSTGTRPASGSQLPDRFSNAAMLGLFPALQPAVSGVAANIGSTLGVNLPGRMWDRQVWVGLVTPVGAILAGRQYTPGYEVAATFDTTKTESSLSGGQIGSFPPTIDIRLANTVAYRIVQGPISAALMYGLHENDPATGRFVGGNVIYKGAKFSAGVAHNTRENEFGQKSLTTSVFGGTADVGPGTAVGQVMLIKDKNPSGLSSIRTALTPLTGAATALVVENAFVRAARQDARLYHVGYRLPVGQHMLSVAYSYLDDRLGTNSDVASYGAVFTYAFSKRTDLNIVLTHFNNKNLAQAAPGQAGFLGGVTASAGTDSNNFAVGIRHRF
ncbi:porin [Piscinibacter sakaiensis]|uniref:porin n=1 Tax=Piscinibacter sakaiensis TaxID=1547922 RepID=UPI003AAAB9B0